MKMKFKGGFKGLLLEHGEKAVFAIGILCFLLFAYGLLGRETLPPGQEPPRLVEAVNQAKDFMEHQTWDATREGISVVDYIARAKREDVVASKFALIVPLDLPLRNPKRKRTDPELLAVVSLRTAAGVGAFALKAEKAAPAPVAAPAAAPAPGRPPRGKKPVRDNKDLEAAPKPAVEPSHRGGPPGAKDAITKKQNWVVITALVPVKKQFAEFEKTFKDTIPIQEGAPAAGANKDAEKQRDFPVYRRPIIERAEIVDGKTAEATWEPVSLKGLGKFIQQWAHTAPEIVGRDYLDPAFTMPLGPLVGTDWDDSVGHEEEIPMAKTEELARDQQKTTTAEPEDAGDPSLPFGVPPKDAAVKAAPRTAQAAKKAEKKIVEYRLFRFFDFDVESGKSYRYRVRLVMNNPNHNLPDKFLKNLDSKKDEFRDTPWSEASPVATIPFGKDMMIAMAQPQKASKEATIRVKLTTIDEELGLPAVMEEDVTRGTLLTFIRSVEVEDKLGGQPIKRDNVNFETNAVVLDIRGGQPLSTKDKQLTAPGEALIFTGEMKLIAHNELDDLELYEANPLPGEKKPEVTPKKKGDSSDLLNGPPKPKKKRKRRSSQ